MIIKKQFLFIMLLAITSCGFQPIHLEKNFQNFAISKTTEEGDKNINRKILSKTNLDKKNNSKTKYNLTIKSSKNNEIISKDTSGDALSYKMSIQVEITLSNPEDPTIIFKQKSFDSSFNYNEKGSKFSLLQYTRTIEANLINKIARDIRIFLIN